MPLLRRPRVHDRRQTLTLEVGSTCCRLWLPHPDEPIQISHFGDAVALTFSLLDAPVEREALVLIGEGDRVVGIVFDPCDVVGLTPGAFLADRLVDDFDRTLVVIPQLDISPEPTGEEVAAYDSLRRRHAVQGLRLVDLIYADTNRVRSMAVASDAPTCWWFERQADEAVLCDADRDTDQGIEENPNGLAA